MVKLQEYTITQSKNNKTLKIEIPKSKDYIKLPASMLALILLFIKVIYESGGVEFENVKENVLRYK